MQFFKLRIADFVMCRIKKSWKKTAQNRNVNETTRFVILFFFVDLMITHIIWYGSCGTSRCDAATIVFTFSIDPFQHDRTFFQVVHSLQLIQSQTDTENRSFLVLILGGSFSVIGTISISVFHFGWRWATFRGDLKQAQIISFKLGHIL